MDEDGALARCAEFCQAIIDESCKSANGFDIELICPTLGTMSLMFGDKLPSDLPITKFWCCALQMVTFLQRHIYNRS